MSNVEVLERQFQKMGARLQVGIAQRGRMGLDIRRDKKGEHFLLNVATVEELENFSVVQVDPADRHLLLMSRGDHIKSKFLCGHDERHWFVAAIPEAASASGIKQAKLALQPEGVREAVERVKPKDALKRKNEAYHRQGEWFFVPLDYTPEGVIMKHEPITRGRGKPHMVEELIRQSTTAVYTRMGGEQISNEQFAALSQEERRGTTWVRREIVGRAFAKGAIRHPDHATIVLDSWHEIIMNTEQRARAMRSVVFMD